ncbi:hypothetical protein V6U90_33040 [Micromonospora sp. CPCC 206060]|uniref:hypothetical protein n=1 Tax=Micromonospora sp. CPCC 206060 TaxID=3122406 RepID=UPI002FF2F16A
MIDLQVRTESGEIVARGSVGLDWVSTLQYVNEDDFPLLGGLLPYGDTVFNSRQAGRLRRELAGLSIQGLIDYETAAEIESLCRQVESGSHLYLWFLGD